MSQDLILSFTKKDWSRTPPTIVHECGPESCSIAIRKEPLTADEKARLDRIAQLKMKSAVVVMTLGSLKCSSLG